MRHDIAFNTIDWWNLPQTVSMIDMKAMWHALAFVAHMITLHMAYVA